MNDLTHIDLFSGIGGFSLAAGWAGFRTICFCEIDPFCQEVLAARFSAVIANPTGERLGGGVKDTPRQQSGLSGQDIPADGAAARFRAAPYADNGGSSPDLREAVSRGQGEAIANPEPSGGDRGGSGLHRPTLIPDIRDFDGTRFRGATLLTGGFPCQPFSHAGKRRGKEDDRAIWPQMLRVIHEARPAWVIGENVSGLISMELDQVLADLELEGYATRTFHIGAVGVNAPHRRMRVWIVAHDSRGAESRGIPSGGRETISETRKTSGNPPPPQDPLIGGDGGRGDGDSTRLRRALQTPRPDSDATNTIGPRAGDRCEAPRDEGGGTGQDRRAGIRQGNGEAGPGRTAAADSDAPDAAASGRGQGNTLTGRPREGTGTQGRGRGPTDGSWDIPWIEVATRLCRVFNGISDWLDTQVNDVIYYNHETKQKDFVEGVFSLREAVQSAAVRGEAGGLFQIFDEKNLLPILRKLSEETKRQGDLSPEGGEVPGDGVRKMWRDAEFRRSPQRREYQKQLAKEFTNLMPSLPHEGALEIARICDEINTAFQSISARRAARLKALGNAIVPQVAYQIIKAIAEIENKCQYPNPPS